MAGLRRALQNHPAETYLPEEGKKPSILVDFDGVINSYKSGWDKHSPGIIKDPPTDGVKDALEHLRKSYILIVFSTRAETEEGKAAIDKYLKEHGLRDYFLCITHRKLPSKFIIDDRAISFKGDWQEVIQNIENYQHWHNKEVACQNRDK